MMLKWFKRILLIALALAAVLGIARALLPKPVLIDTATVDRGEMVVTVNEDGTTRIREVYQVVAPVTGNVLRFPLKVGDPVAAEKTIVAVIEPTRPEFLDARQRQELRATLAAAEAAVRVAEANLSGARMALQLARNEYNRLARLNRDTLISQSVLEQAELEVSTRGAALDSAAAELELRRREQESIAARLIGPDNTELCAADAEQNCINITSPIDGVLLSITNESEHVARTGEPLVEVGDLKDLEVVVDLLSSDAVNIRPGAEVILEGWGGDDQIRGEVRSVEPVAFDKVSALGIEEQRVKTIVSLDGQVAAGKGLGHNYKVRARIITWQSADSQRVPMGAIFRNRQSWAVYRVVDDSAQLTPITIGHFNDEYAEVVSGLQSGDSIILYPSDRIEDGVKVARREMAAN